MTVRITTEEANFLNGEPHFEYDHIYKCFQHEGNGLLFRLVNEKNQQWAFYNDTIDTVIKVAAIFSPGNTIKALRTARLEVLPSADGNEALSEQRVTLEVAPGRTELFIQGEVNGFSMDFQCEAAPSTDVKFENRMRDLPPYDKVYKCFKSNGNGLLFRLVDEKNKKWYYYNDTKEFVMQATVTFADRDVVKPLGKTVETGVPADNADGVIYCLSVEPGKAEPFIEGEPAGYTQAFAADPIENDRVDPDEVEYLNGAPDPNVADPHRCKVYKCFQNNGNGLLFRMINEEEGYWAFYNDTKDYVMKPKVRFFHNPQMQPYPEAEVFRDEEEEDAIVVTMEIPPLETMRFIDGCPASYELSVTAEGTTRSTPEEAPQYENGRPDTSIASFDTVYRCFKDRGNGLLFRLVDSKSGKWAFYNDTTDMYFTARVAFDPADRVRTLGNTQMDKDADMGLTYVLTIPPQSTEPFISGDVHGFTSKFTAGRRSVPASAAGSVPASSHGV